MVKFVVRNNSVCCVINNDDEIELQPTFLLLLLSYLSFSYPFLLYLLIQRACVDPNGPSCLVSSERLVLCGNQECDRRDSRKEIEQKR